MVRLTVRHHLSSSRNARSRMEIHMSEDAMTAAEFEAAFMDEAATEEIRLTRTADADDPAKGIKRAILSTTRCTSTIALWRASAKAREQNRHCHRAGR